MFTLRFTLSAFRIPQFRVLPMTVSTSWRPSSAFSFIGMPVADGSFGWQWLVIFLGGLTNVSRLKTA